MPWEKYTIRSSNNAGNKTKNEHLHEFKGWVSIKSSGSGHLKAYKEGLLRFESLQLVVGTVSLTRTLAFAATEEAIPIMGIMAGLIDEFRPASKELHLPYSDIRSVNVLNKKGSSIEFELTDGRIVRFNLADTKAGHKLISMFYICGVNVIN